jgi:hypothetical protein
MFASAVSDYVALVVPPFVTWRSVHQSSRRVPMIEIFDQFGYVVGWARRAEQVPLHLGARLRSQQSQLGFGFHTFGRYSHTQSNAEIDDRVNDCRRVGALIQVSDERLIDLDLIEGETKQADD